MSQTVYIETTKLAGSPLIFPIMSLRDLQQYRSVQQNSNVPNARSGKRSEGLFGKKT